MIAFIKRNLFIIIIFLLTLSLSFITFLTFIDKSFIELNEQNLQLVLVVNIIFLLLFFILIFIDIKNSVKNNILKIDGIKDVDLKLVWDPPWTKDKMSEAAKLELNL